MTPHDPRACLGYTPPMIQITIDAKQIERLVGTVNSRQLPFAAALALTQTAKDAQASVRASMPAKFTLRRQWIVQGIRIKPANKTTLEAWVYSKDAFMARQETGGIKTGKPGGGNFSSSSVAEATKGVRARPVGGRVAVPTDKVLRNKSDIIRKSDLPAGLGKKAFVIGKGGNEQYLARRFSKGKRAGLQILYVLKGSTYIKPRLGLEEITTKVVERRFNKHFSEAFERAISTAR